MQFRRGTSGLLRRIDQAMEDEAGTVGEETGHDTATGGGVKNAHTHSWVLLQSYNEGGRLLDMPVFFVG